MKKNLYIIMIIVLFISFSNTVKAACGDIVYEVTDFKITGSSIIFKGWSYIHRTQNTNKTVFINGGTEKSTSTPRIVILAVKNSDFNNPIMVSTTSNEAKKSLPNYNFYRAQYFNYSGGSSNSNIDYPKTQEWVNACNNTTTANIDNTQCYYENIGFNISFDINDLISEATKRGITEQDNIEFYIFETNDDYNKKKCVSNVDIPDRDGNENKYINADYDGNGNANWVGSSIFIYKGSMSSTNSNSRIEVTAGKENNIAFSTVINGLPRNKAGTLMNNTYLGMKQEFNISSKIETPEDIYIAGKPYIGPGFYLISGHTTTEQPEGNTGINEYYFVPNGNETARVRRSWVKLAGDTSIKIKVKSDKKCTIPPASPKKDMKCNNWTNLSSTCKELTVINGDARANATITQKGYIANVFKSNLVNTDQNYNASSYNGGWFKYGITYYNEVSWEFINGDALSQDVKNKITEAMQDRLNDLTKFENNLVLNIKGLNDTKPITKCTASGSFTSGNKLITTCTFFLPSSEINNNLSGKVTYSQSDTTAGINNRYYIPTSESNHKIDATLSGLSRLNVDQANTDSALAKKGNKKSWLGDWSISTTCSLQVKDRLTNTPSTDGSGTNTEKVKYKFIYRPINLSNPFPNRYPGINWYDWYITENNKDKKTLEESYSKLDYYVNLDNKTISEIKKYNQNKTYFGEVEKEFFNQYIKEGGS